RSSEYQSGTVHKQNDFLRGVLCLHKIYAQVSLNQTIGGKEAENSCVPNFLNDIAQMVAELKQSDYPGGWWTTLPDGRIECRLCPRFCKLNEGQRGFCFVRQRVGDRMVLTTYGRSSGLCVDPIEKKPLNHFLPGTS